ncbi:putative ABC transport system ATP-binding protein [Hydrogenispora ethanolica]|jgi:putative ABC transport system ATP-binding protein|uniref:Putative ABC transport system ATP-binding protein n=1 Tax=Hydrogenispora ethanolica TaxID=1082276 RepID=A0A4R1RRC7_HYDET|nr:ABC transporter ATP-binding protein [Hydrogenispora ethanolica]TCL68580.1 putative ABC transport system ATP-binding protein [Hydrogenispora ethanolica]
MIKMENICKVYRMGDTEVWALDQVSLMIEEGEMVAIMGPSGSGKSTIMNMIGCLDQPSSGSYRLAGREVANLSERELAAIRNQEIGFVFQSFHLLPNLTALQNVELPLVYAGAPPAERHQQALDALKKMGLEQRIHHKPRELSGGQQQRVAIARALVNGPKLLLADEPTGNLDSRASVEIMGIFQDLHRKGMTIVMVTHEPDIATYTQRILRFRDGKIMADELNKQVFIPREEWTA